ncbi:B-cell receptor CD22 [Notothenia coriiceps]|uniref:B-cell receptor CD22 n=1 Tax=Notothenia coriiceps TaxID=8208 RepID=A0A6I9PM10_9TELE|nr:PREDICTED: B-cell receptor CD22-like [Notothenia coriiceps]
MFAKIFEWLVFLAIIKELSCVFSLKETPLTATEGSCIKITCNVNKRVDVVDAHWFWMKNATWDKGSFTGTVIYSSNNTLRSVSPAFAERVSYIGSPFSRWKDDGTPSKECSIIICNLTKTDSGNYYFRYIGKQGRDTWMTKPPSRITVTENPCPITFETPPAVNETNSITLTCSTSSSCTSDLQIHPRCPNSNNQSEKDEKQKRITDTFKVTWLDDGKEFSCQTQNNPDSYLIRNISVTVEYAPKNTLAEMSPINIVEGQNVTLRCSAKGNPDPTFTWYKNEKAGDVNVKNFAVWDIPSIGESWGGEYQCEAINRHGTNKSDFVKINVTYKPEVQVVSSTSEVKQGDELTLTCKVTRSNPQPTTYVWSKNGTSIGQRTQLYVVKRIEPENKGSYTCTATNTVGNGTSDPLQIIVKYGPRKTTISNHGIKEDPNVGVGSSITFQCNTDANPAPTRYSWYRYNKNKRIDSLQWTSRTTDNNTLCLNKVQRSDEACYMCNATNLISTGEDSEPKCIQVMYAPTSVRLSMDAAVREGQLITINCIVESFPPSQLTLTMTPTSTPQPSEKHLFEAANDWPHNTLQHKFNLTSTHTGNYFCTATNSQGSTKSNQTTLVVKYSPKNVTIRAEPALTVNENKSLTLHCSAKSHPPATSFTWMKMTDGKSKIIWKTHTFSLKSVSYSDSGLYRCTACNEIGAGDSMQADVKVNYAPKHTKILRAEDGTHSVALSCSSHSYPPVIQYVWYKENTGEKDVKVHDRQNYTVYSDQPGVYYCTAKNKINPIQSSEKIHLFDQSWMKVLFRSFLFFITLILILTIFFVYRKKRKTSIQQGSTNTLPCIGFLGWRMGPRVRNRINEPRLAEPSRSRDDLLPEQPRRPKAQRCQPSPDCAVYSLLNLPSEQSESAQRPFAQRPIRQQGGHTQDDSLNYASLHFGNKQQNKQAEEEVYAIVSKDKKNEKRLQDYENISTAHSAISPNPLTDDTDTSEDELEINYSQVNFKAKT